MSRKPRITVAGAGALGLTTALALADAGAQVAVYDPSPDGGNASAVAAGMLAPVFEAVLDAQTRAHFDLMLAARDLWPALEARIGITVDRAGAMAVGDAAFLHTIDAGVRKLGLHPTELSRNAMTGLAPGLAPGLGHGLLTREDWRIDAAAALVALRRAAQAAGVTFHARAADGFEGAERLVIATGMGADLAVMAPLLNRLSPIKGHILRTERPAYAGIVVRGEGAYVTGSPGGLTLGATMQAGADDLALEADQVSGLLEAGARLFPALKAATVTAQTGVRAATPDGLPMVGQGLHHGVLLAVGARRNGWLLAPLVAKIITACVTEGDLGPYAGRLDPERFKDT
jgi:glycine oxidase